MKKIYKQTYKLVTIRNVKISFYERDCISVNVHAKSVFITNTLFMYFFMPSFMY